MLSVAFTILRAHVIIARSAAMATSFRYLICLWCLFSLTTLRAQNAPGTPLTIRQAAEPITLDGRLDDAAWQVAALADGWFTTFPIDTAAPQYGTTARVTFDEEFLYVAFVCEDDSAPNVINSLRRDFFPALNDHVRVVIGPYNDRLNGFFFGVTPAGVQSEGIVATGGTSNGSRTTWDNKWYSQVIREPNRWTVEMAIPFSSFRYQNGLREWNISLVRADRKRNVVSTWIGTPIQFTAGAFAYSGQLVWEDAPPPPGLNLSLIPYVAGRGAQDRSNSGDSIEAGLQVGFDGKYSLTPSLNLDVTVNPDFSQVEVDQQVINLTRFEIQLPERRQFFLENSDLLDQAGFPSARPFFSRRIGLVQDSQGLYQPVPILYGARLSGSLDRQWRLNVLNMQTQVAEGQGLPAQNFTAAAVQRNFGAQSSIALSLVNKANLGVNPGDTARFFHPSIFREVEQGDTVAPQLSRSNQVLTADLELLSADNRWYHSSFVSRSFTNYGGAMPYAASVFNRFQSRRWEVFVGSNYVGESYFAEVGFVPSQGVYPGFLDAFVGGAYKHFPQKGPLVFMGPTYNLNHSYVPGGSLTDRDYQVGYTFNFLSTAQLTVSARHIYQRLTRRFNPIREADTVFQAGEEFSWELASINFQSNRRRRLNYNVTASYGGFYNGRNFNLSGQLTYRYQPYGNISLQFDYNDVALAEGYGAGRLFLLGPRIDLTFTDALFLTTYVQYNSRLDNLNLNARFQWRYAPASDFFLVYTENYLPTNLYSKNRALVFKLVYWLNV
jgi:hypothetical protein